VNAAAAFADLLEPRRPSRRAAARLLVRDGLHAGAWMTLRQPQLRLGSAQDGDVWLSDAGMPAQAAVLLHSQDGWRVDVPAEAAQGGMRVLLPDGESVRTRWRRRRWVLHGVTLVVIDAAPSSRGTRRAARRWALNFAVGGGALVLAAAGVVAAARINQPTAQSRIARALPSLASLQLPGVQLRRADDGVVEVTGHVDDAAQLDRVRGWVGRADLGGARVRVQPLSALIGHVREALGNTAELRVSHGGNGRLRIEGSTASAELKRRVQALVADMRASVPIDDHVALLEGREAPPVKRALPIRIVNVMLGANPYFQTDAGATYFLGATLPDGAEVTSIDALRIVFKLDGREVVYRLDN
jgi:hypothetical protein